MAGLMAEVPPCEEDPRPTHLEAMGPSGSPFLPVAAGLDLILVIITVMPSVVKGIEQNKSYKAK
jgi:hypothetical protein